MRNRSSFYGGASTRNRVATVGYDEQGVRARGLSDNYTFSSSASDVLPDQFYSGKAWKPHQLLMAAILLNAIGEICRYRRITSRRAARIVSEAEWWIMNNDDQWIFSFINICLTLGVDSGKVRRAILNHEEIIQTEEVL